MNYDIGSQVLAFSSDGLLYKAKIVYRLGKHEVFVHYDGWGTRWDEWKLISDHDVMPINEETLALQAYIRKRRLAGEDSDSESSSDSSVEVDVDCEAPLVQREAKRGARKVDMEHLFDPMGETSGLRRWRRALRGSSDTLHDDGTLSWAAARDSWDKPLPPDLSRLCFYDWQQVTQRGYVPKIPCHVNIEDIMNDYTASLLKGTGQSSAKSEAAEGSVTGISGSSTRALLARTAGAFRRWLYAAFDAALPRTLLYEFEREQWACIYAVASKRSRWTPAPSDWGEELARREKTTEEAVVGEKRPRDTSPDDKAAVKRPCVAGAESAGSGGEQGGAGVADVAAAGVPSDHPEMLVRSLDSFAVSEILTAFCKPMPHLRLCGATHLVRFMHIWWRLCSPHHPTVDVGPKTRPAASPNVPVPSNTASDLAAPAQMQVTLENAQPTHTQKETALDNVQMASSAVDSGLSQSVKPEETGPTEGAPEPKNGDGVVAIVHIKTENPGPTNSPSHNGSDQRATADAGMNVQKPVKERGGPQRPDRVSLVQLHMRALARFLVNSPGILSLHTLFEPTTQAYKQAALEGMKKR